MSLMDLETHKERRCAFVHFSQLDWTPASIWFNQSIWG